ncbi:MAG: hypothetical protein U0133_00335 [Gemmatimonadales bacterium]
MPGRLPAGRGPRPFAALWLFAIAGIALVAAGKSLAAQQRIEITPYVTGHWPLLTYNRISGTGPDIGDLKQTLAPGFGGKVTWWTSPGYALELDLGYNTSGTRIAPDSLEASYGTFERAGSQVAATVSLVHRPPGTRLLLGIGMGYIRRSGDAWDADKVGVAGKFSHGNFTTAMSAGVDVRVSRGLRIRPSAAALVYWVRKYEPSEPGLFRSRNMQIDLEAKLGVPIGL